MNLVLEGAVAATGAAVLMIGGVGSLAYWSDSETVTNATVTSGELKLGTPACGSGWVLDGGTTFTAGMKLVPGDVLTKTCTIDLIATGQHLTADLGISTPSWGGTTGLTAELVPSATFTVNGDAQTTVTQADAAGGSTTEITAVIEVAFPGDEASNASQAMTAALDGVVVTATQQPH